MPPPPIRPPMWNQPQIPGTDLPPIPSGNSSFPPPPPPGTSVSIHTHTKLMISCINRIFLSFFRIGVHLCLHPHNTNNNIHGVMEPGALSHHCRQSRHHHLRHPVVEQLTCQLLASHQIYLLIR